MPNAAAAVAIDGDGGGDKQHETGTTAGTKQVNTQTNRADGFGGGVGGVGGAATRNNDVASNNNLSKFSATLTDLSDLPTATTPVERSRRSKAHQQQQHSISDYRNDQADDNNNDDNDSYCLSGEESEIWSVHYSDVSSDNDDADDNAEADAMGLKPKRRPKRNRTKITAAAAAAKKAAQKAEDAAAAAKPPELKLDTKRKCYVVEEAATRPMIATPRPLQKRWHYFSDSDVSNTDSDTVSPSNSSSDDDDDESGSDDGCYNVRLLPGERRGSEEIRAVRPKVDEAAEGGGESSSSAAAAASGGSSVRMSTCSNDSGFEGGTAPASPRKMLGECVCE